MSITKAELIRENARLRKRVALLERARRRRTAGSEQSRGLRIELAEALEKQTATSEILRVISSSPTDEQPVFDTIARRAVELCNGTMSAAFRLQGDTIHYVAGHGHRGEEVEEMRRRFPRTLKVDDMPGRAIATRQVVRRDG